MGKSNKTPLDFYLRGNVEKVAPKLLGKVLCSRVDGILCGGKIVEVEAYCGKRDKACHAYFGKTKRNKIMFENGGLAYVYLCYGIHNLFNIVVGGPDNPSAVLIRGVEPVLGIDAMLERRGFSSLSPNLSNGPGKLSQALGIGMEHYGALLTGTDVWLEDRALVKKRDILVGPRIGIDYAGEDKWLPWRFGLDSPYTGHKKNLTFEG
ncbi:MAG: DNA-3-methyladenine glycosylase [Bacteriovoracaceae bacterium]